MEYRMIEAGEVSIHAPAWGATAALIGQKNQKFPAIFPQTQIFKKIFFPVTHIHNQQQTNIIKHLLNANERQIINSLLFALTKSKHHFPDHNRI